MELAARYRRPLIAYLGPKGAITGLLRERLPADALTQTEVETFVLQQTDEDR